MLTFLAAPDHVAAYRFSNSLTEGDLDRVIADVESRLKRFEKLAVLADMSDFHDISLRAGLKDMRYGFSKIFEWRRFPREAIVTHRQWIKMLVHVVDPLIPAVTVRTFEPTEADAALAWASDIDVVPRTETAHAH